MQYLLLIYANEAAAAAMGEAASHAMFAEYGSFTKAIIQEGKFKAGDALKSTTTACSTSNCSRAMPWRGGGSPINEAGSEPATI